MADHEFGEIPHYWLSLHIEIPQHFVTPPASNEADYVIFDAGTEECHGACYPNGSCRDVFMCELQMGYREEFYGGLEVGRDHCGFTFVQHPLGVLKRSREVFAGAFCCSRCVTRRCRASFGHNSGSPVAPSPIFFPARHFSVC